MVTEKKRLGPKQELFCRLYAEPGEYFGNGTQAYIEAYAVDLTKKGAHAVARAGAYENLSKPHILARVRELLELGPLNEETVDRELAFVILQSADMQAKVGAIREYNQLKARIIKKLDVKVEDLRPMVVDSTVAARFADAASEPTTDSKK